MKMGPIIGKDNAKKSQPKAGQSAKKTVYANEEVKNFAFADYVMLRANSRGMLFSFGKDHPGEEAVRLFEEIFIPLDVAYSLLRIMTDQFEELKRQNVIQHVEEK